MSASECRGGSPEIFPQRFLDTDPADLRDFLECAQEIGAFGHINRDACSRDEIAFEQKSVERPAFQVSRDAGQIVRQPKKPHESRGLASLEHFDGENITHPGLEDFGQFAGDDDALRGERHFPVARFDHPAVM